MTTSGSHPSRVARHPLELVKQEGENIDMKPAACTTSGPDRVHIAPSELKTDSSGTVPSAPSAAVEDGDAYGPLSQDFIQAFFPELGSDVPLSA